MYLSSLAVLLIACGAIVATFTADYGYGVACLVAPFGAIGRWLLSKLNGRAFTACGMPMQWFPVGTLLANLAATAIAAALHIVVAEGEYSEGWTAVITGLASGFVGSLSTVSTFVTELSSLPPRRGIVYGGLSIALAQIMLGIILGIHRSA